MSVKAFIGARVTSLLLAPQRQARQRQTAETKRLRQGRDHQVFYFHQADDPYAHLMLPALHRLAESYAVEVLPHLVNPPADWAAPERQLLDDYALKDAQQLAARMALQANTESVEQPLARKRPAPAQIAAAESHFAKAIMTGRFLADAPDISASLWAGELVALDFDAAEIKAQGDAVREKLGHYLSAMCYYEGEWYWGLDRLPYLEQRLRDLNLGTTSAHEIFLFPNSAGRSQNRQDSRPAAGVVTANPALNTGLDAGSDARPKADLNADLDAAETVVNEPAELHFYLSFRSPYTYIAIERAAQLARAYGAELKLRFVLPMVMRNLPVRRAKGFYILKDVAREAQRLGVPFGRIADPVGRPVERGYAILPWAISSGRGYEYCLSFMQGVWSEGIDAGSDRGLAKLVERAGLSWAAAKGLLGSTDWQVEAEANRTELFQFGLWGVPSFRVNQTATWGQDRLWLIEAALAAQSR